MSASSPSSSTASRRDRCTTAGSTRTRARSTGPRLFGNSSTRLGSRLFGAEKAIAGVAEPGQDVAVRVETAVERSGDDRHIRENRRHIVDAFWSGDETDELD